MSSRLVHRTNRRTGLLAMAAAFAVVSSADAQGTAPGATGGGLFGATRSDVNDRNHLNVTLALNEGWDTELPAELRDGLPQNSRHAGGFSTMLTGTADYAHIRRRAQFVGNIETAFRYYGRLKIVDPVGHSGSLGANFRLARMATFRVDQTAAYSPSFLYGLFPSTTAPASGDTIPVAPEYTVLDAESYRYKSEAEFAVGSAAGTRASVAAAYDRTDFRNFPGNRPRLESYSGRAKVNRRVRRNVNLSGQYEYRNGDFGFIQSGLTVEHRVSVGGDYYKALSGGRRWSVRGNFTPSLLEVPTDELLVPDGRVYKMQGDATLEYAFKRTWRIAGTARRSAEYLAVLGEPVLSDSGQLELQGLISRRIDVLASAASSSAASVLNVDRRLETYTGTARVRYALTRSIAAYGEYIYYYYDMRRYRRQVEGLPALFDQQGVRIGVMLWGSAF